MSLKNISVRQLTKFSITSVAQELFIDSLISNHDETVSIKGGADFSVFDIN